MSCFGGERIMTDTKRIVFIGDSITEWGRFDDDENLGENYVRMIHDYLKVTYPEKKLEIINKGIGGNRIIDLAARWDKDVIELNPDVVSISIGVNDVWRQIDQPEIEQVYPEQFKQVYNDILTELKMKTNAKIILMEPTVMKEDIRAEGNKMLIPYIEATHRLAETYDALLVPTHDAFLDYLRKGNYPLTTDGVHMNSAGNTLMALTWMRTVRSLFE